MYVYKKKFHDYGVQIYNVEKYYIKIRVYCILSTIRNRTNAMD